MALDPKHVDKALRELISRLDYDTHKYLECDEDNGEDRYPELVEEFIGYYVAAEENTADDESDADGDFDEEDDDEESEEDFEEGFGGEDPDYDE